MSQQNGELADGQVVENHTKKHLVVAVCKEMIAE
jgi:hypothetical protein